MHLNLRLPKVEPQEIQTPTQCPFRDPQHRNKKCTGTHFKAHHLHCRKPLRDTKHAQVTAQRFRCLKCHRTFRVYPIGVSHAHPSDTLKGLRVVLYILGLRYPGVADLLEALQYPLSKTTVDDNVQAAGQRAIQLRREWWRQLAGPVKVLGIDFTQVKSKGQDKMVAVATAVLHGASLDFALLPSESALPTQPWMEDWAHVLGAEIMVPDEADGLKTVADDLALHHQICRAHVNRNVHAVIAALGEKALEHLDPVPWEWNPRDVSVDQFLADLPTAECVIAALPADGQHQLEQLVERYQSAPPPSQGHQTTMWDRFRRLAFDWSENWSRLSLFQRWRGAPQEKLDGTNNVTEQIIGQRVKERYCTLRGYTRDESILTVSS